MAQNTSNAADVFIDRAEIYIDRLDSSRARTGERFAGVAEAFSMTTEDEVRDQYDLAQATAPLLKSVNVRRTISVGMTLKEVNQENLELLHMGTKTNFAQTGATKTGYVPPTARVKKGYWFPLEDPAGTPSRGPITGVAITGKTLTTDYLVDATAGRIYVVPSGTIADATSLSVDFTYPTISGTTLPYVQGGVSNFIEAFVRLIGKPATGPTMEYQFWVVSLRPDGDFNLLGDDYADLRLRGRVLSDATNHPNEPNFVAFEVAA